MSKGFSGSTIKSWFQYRCERKVRYELSSDAELAAVPIVKDVREQPWAILGNEFERRVIDRLHREVGVLRPSRGEYALAERLTGAFLRGQRTEPYAAQVNLKPSSAPHFLEGTGLHLNRNIADLLRWGPPAQTGEAASLTIIDVKATRRATAFHKTQVAFYVRILGELLKEIDPASRGSIGVSHFGEIWRIPDHGTAEGDEWQAERFSLSPYLRLVDEFCRDVLPGIAAKQVRHGTDETFFHVYFKCEQCSFLDHCLGAIAPERGAKRRDVSAVAGLTHEGKRALARLGIRTVADLAGSPGLTKAPGVGWSLSRRALQLVARATALATGAPGRTEEQHTFLMPPRADTVLLLSVDHDPIDDRIAAIGYRRVDAGVSVSQHVAVPQTGSSADEAEAMVATLSALIADLTEIDARNAALTAEGRAGAGIHAHIFFYEPAEATNLQRAVGRHLQDERVRSGLLHLVRLFPPEDVVPEPEFRGVHHLPATAIRSVIEQLWALPVTVAYDLRQVSQAIETAGGGPAYVPAPAFERPFSSLLSIDVIRALREGHRSAVPLAAIRQDVAARLDALQGLIRWLFDQNREATEEGRPLLRLSKKPFRFQASFDPLNAIDLDILLACELLENRAGLLEALIGLAQPAERRRDAARCLAALDLRKHWAFGGNRVLLFHVPESSREAELGPGDFDLILSDDSPDLRLDPGLWPQLACRIRPPEQGWEDRRDLVQIQVDGNVFTGDVFQALLRNTLPGGWHVDRAFRDVNTGKAASFLANLVRGDAA
jgi:hypothetical protein